MPLVKPISIKFEADAKNLETKLDILTEDFDKFAAHNRAASDSADKAAKTATMSWTDFRSMYSTVLDVVRVGQQVWEVTGQAFADYAEQVELIARTAGTTSEEASRMIQVANGMGVTYTELKTMMTKMTAEGIVPSIEAMARLSDQYLAIQDPAERAKFLLDNFGRSGAEMGRLMEKGRDGIYALNSEIDKNLILTAKQLELAEGYRVATDQMTGAWEGFKISIGAEAMPVLLDILQKANAEIEEAGGLVDKLAQSWIYLLGPIGAAIGFIDTLTNKTKSLTVPSITYALTPPRRGRAAGGSVAENMPYMVGERGVEMFVPNESGSIVPNNKLGNSNIPKGKSAVDFDYDKMGKSVGKWVVRALAQAGG